MKRLEFLKEHYSIIISSQIDARKRTLVFSITKKALFIVSCFMILTVLLSVGVIIYSQYSAQLCRVQIAQLNSNIPKEVLSCKVDQTSGLTSLNLVASFENDTELDTSEMLPISQDYGLKRAVDPYTNSAPEKVSIPRTDVINENTIKQLISVDMIDAIEIIDSKFEKEIEQRIATALANNEYDNGEIVYNGDFEGDSNKVNNWADVLSIFLAQTMSDEQKMLTIPSEKIDLLSEIYNSMNEIDISIVTNEEENLSESQDKSIPTVNVTINSLTYMEGAELFELNPSQKEKLEQLMSPNYYIYFSELLGIDVYSGMDYEEVRDIIDNLPDTKGGDIVRAALIRLGSPYSRSKRGTGDYVDCSYFAWWSYDQAGISIPTSSVMQAKYCYDNGFAVDKEDLQPGDLIFWTKKSCRCGRWHEIHHVGIYISDNTIIEASSGKGCVYIGPLWGIDGKTWKVFMYARPE